MGHHHLRLHHRWPAHEPRGKSQTAKEPVSFFCGSSLPSSTGRGSQFVRTVSFSPKVPPGLHLGSDGGSLRSSLWRSKVWVRMQETKCPLTAGGNMYCSVTDVWPSIVIMWLGLLQAYCGFPVQGGEEPVQSVPSEACISESWKKSLV